jgi:hypothetical protein
VKAWRGRLLSGAFAALGLTGLFACAVTGVGVDVGVGYSGGYYEPYGYDHGGWGHGYEVGPSRGGEHRDDGHHEAGHSSHQPAYRSAPPGRSAPSIPSRSRGH